MNDCDAYMKFSKSVKELKEEIDLAQDELNDKNMKEFKAKIDIIIALCVITNSIVIVLFIIELIKVIG